jgi:hypothetical protein
MYFVSGDTDEEASTISILTDLSIFHVLVVFMPNGRHHPLIHKTNTCRGRQNGRA